MSVQEHARPAATAADLSASIALQRSTVFTNLFTGKEFAAHQTSGLYVTLLFYLLLQRPPEASELARWLGSTELQIIDGLTGSAEFLAAFQ